MNSSMRKANTSEFASQCDFDSFVSEVRQCSGQSDDSGSSRIVSLNERDFLFYQNAECHEYFFIACDIMPLPQEPQKLNSLLRAVLEYNLEFYTGFAPVLAADTQRRVVLSVAKFNLAQVTPKDVSDLLKTFCQKIPEMASRLSTKKAVVSHGRSFNEHSTNDAFIQANLRNIG